MNSLQQLEVLKKHSTVFEVQELYPIKILENLVEQIALTTDKFSLELSCKIEQDKLYGGRIQLGFEEEDSTQNFNIILDFLRQVESRVDVNLDYSLLNQLIGSDCDFSKVTEMMVGVDSRPKFSDSRLKISLTLADYPEKIAKAIALTGLVNQNITSLLIYNKLHLGFDLSFDGRSAIEIYPFINKQDLVNPDIQELLTAYISPEALQILPFSSRLLIGLSKANIDKILYFYLDSIDDFLNCFSPNDIAKKVHAYYRSQPVAAMCVALPEKQLLAATINNMNLYYYI